MYIFVCNLNCMSLSCYLYFFKLIGRRTIVFINGIRINVNNNNINNNNNNNNSNNINNNQNETCQ